MVDYEKLNAKQITDLKISIRKALSDIEKKIDNVNTLSILILVKDDLDDIVETFDYSPL